MKRSLKGIILIILFNCGLVNADSLMSLITPKIYKKGLIWQIESSQGGNGYVIGTMHVNDPGVWALFEHASEYFNKASIVCTEVKLDFITAAAEMRAMFFNDGRTLKSVIDDNKLYQRIISLADERGLPEVMVRNMKPFTLVFMLSMPVPKGQVLDEKIYTDAIRQGKQSCGLETVEEHSRVFGSFNMDEQVSMLKMTVKNIKEIDAIYPVLLKAYLSRDLVAMADLVSRSMMMNDKRIEKIFLQKFLIDRNKTMAERMIANMEKGSSFFAIGAMHLPGEGGVLRLLEKRGYKISVVY